MKERALTLHKLIATSCRRCTRKANGAACAIQNDISEGRARNEVVGSRCRAMRTAEMLPAPEAKKPRSRMTGPRGASHAVDYSWLVQLAAKTGLPLAQAMRQAGLPTSTLSNIRSRGRASETVLARIAAAIGCEVKDITNGPPASSEEAKQETPEVEPLIDPVLEVKIEEIRQDPVAEDKRAVVAAAIDLSARQIGGSHYASKKIQPWDAMQEWMTPEQFAGFLRGNIIKYIARCDDKGGLEDLEKARHYLDKLIEVTG